MGQAVVAHVRDDGGPARGDLGVQLGLQGEAAERALVGGEVERLGALARQATDRVEARALDDAADGVVDLALAGLLEGGDVEARLGLGRRGGGGLGGGFAGRLAGFLALGGGELLRGDEARGGELALRSSMGGDL
ncbi:hypothetical protein [Nannocystis pusilla]|uniref:hypothetical protein n=1 Tax=Nannocystis pusilla TaxID=889268 RepID=UPI003B7DA02C